MKQFIQQECEKKNLKSHKVETEPVEMLQLNVGVAVVIKCEYILYNIIYTLNIYIYIKNEIKNYNNILQATAYQFCTSIYKKWKVNWTDQKEMM